MQKYDDSRNIQSQFASKILLKLQTNNTMNKLYSNIIIDLNSGSISLESIPLVQDVTERTTKASSVDVSINVHNIETPIVTLIQ